MYLFKIHCAFRQDDMFIDEEISTSEESDEAIIDVPLKWR